MKKDVSKCYNSLKTKFTKYLAATGDEDTGFFAGQLVKYKENPGAFGDGEDKKEEAKESEDDSDGSDDSDSDSNGSDDSDSDSDGSGDSDKKKEETKK
jgi:hypothetical protein